MDVPIATYTQHEKAVKFLPARRAAEYARFFETTPEYILYGRAEALPDRVPILNCHGEDTGHSASLPPAPSEITSAQQPLEGDGIAYFGFVALYDHPQTKAPPTSLSGKLCVVALYDSEGRSQRLIRVLQNGSIEGRFHLLDPNFLPMIDQELEWAAPVIALVPAIQ